MSILLLKKRFDSYKTLDLNFTSGVLDSRVSFSRGSNATLVGSNGLIQYAPHNLMTYSEQFDNAVWTKGTGVTVTANAISAPDGTTTADLISAPQDLGCYENVLSIGTGVTVTNSVYIKAGTATQLLFRDDLGAGRHIVINPVTGQITGSSGTIIASGSVAIGNGWYRYFMTYVTDSANTRSWVRNNTTGTLTYYEWGAQLNEGALQPYYPTTSTAYYGPRFDYDPATLAPKGLLIEEQRTNLLLQSAFASGWSFGNSASAGTITAPDGTNTGIILNDTSSVAAGYIYQGASMVSGITYAWSIYAKAQNRNDITLTSFTQAGNLTFSLVDAGSVGVASGIITGGSIQQLGNNWYRCTVIMTANATGTNNIGYNTNQSTYTGNAFAIWGAQLEAGAFPTSYIPTTSATVTRAADNVSMVGSNFSSWYNQSEGTFGFNGDVVSNSGNRVYFDVGAGGVFGTTAYAIQTSTYVGLLPGAVPVNMNSTVNTTALTNKIATAMQNNNSIIAVNASLGGIDAACTMPASATTLTVGCSQFGGTFGNYLNGHIQSIKYYPRRLPNADLQRLTR